MFRTKRRNSCLARHGTQRNGVAGERGIQLQVWERSREEEVHQRDDGERDKTLLRREWLSGIILPSWVFEKATEKMLV
jgi:hypothetical protein